MPPARGRAACNICRTRKQKCDGIRPACSRCRRFGSQCTWPTVLKRGPPKGYTKALETRLRETEIVLIRLLRSTNDQELLSRAFNDNIEEPGFDGTITEHSTGEQGMLALMNHWERFPLRTADNVAQWIEEASSNSIVQDGAGRQVAKKMGQTSQVVRHSDDIDHQSEPVVGTEDVPPVESHHDRSLNRGCISLPSVEIPSVDTVQASKLADKADEVRNNTASGISQLPAGFKEQFLW